MTRLRDYLNKRSMFTVFGITFMLISLLTLAIVFNIYREVVNEQVEQEVKADTEIIAKFASDHINNILRISNEYLENISITIKASNDEGIELYVNSINNDNSLFSKIEILDYDGNVKFTTADNEASLYLNRSGEIVVQNIISGSGKTYSTSVNLVEDGKSMTIAKEAGDYIVIGYKNLYELYSSIATYIDEDSRVFEMVLTDEYGIYLAGTEYEHIQQRRRFDLFDTFKAEIDNNSNSFDIVIGDEKFIVSSKRIIENDWYLFVYEGTQNLQNRFLLYSKGPISVIAIVFAAFGFSFLLFSKLLKKYINRFIYSTELVSKGNFDTNLPATVFKEFSLLSSNFNNMSKAVNDRNIELHEIAYSDSLTGLSTRNKVLQDFKSAKYKNAAFIYVDLNKFKTINDTYGHKVGDEILQDLGRVLTETFNNYNETVARIGGDELLIVINDYENKEQVYDRVLDLKKIETICFTTSEISIYLSFSIGVSFFPEHGDVFEYLMSCADIAMYDYRYNKKGDNFRVYSEEMRTGFDQKTILSTSIDSALNNDNFDVVYQPIIDAVTNDVRGFEVLSRWSHPEIGVVSPDDFIKILEDKESINILDLTVLKKSSKDINELRAFHKKDFILSINFSAIHLTRPDFITNFLEVVEEYEVNTDLLEIEITESAFVKDFDLMKKVVNELSEMGIMVSEDDFGTGYSSLNYLIDLDISTLKIPRDFLKGYDKDEKTRTIINSLISLNNDLNIKVIIEGIETKDQADTFKEIGADYLQGYYYGHPMKFDLLGKYITKSA